MNASNILDTAKSSGIGLFVVDGKLRVEAPVGMLTPELRGEIASHKQEIVLLLTARSMCSTPPLDVEALREFAEERAALGYTGDVSEEAARQAAFLLWARNRRIMTYDVATQLAVDSEAMFLRLWRRLSKRISRVYPPGCLEWVQANEPALWARREAAREEWDTPAVYADFTACRISWAAYRRLIYTWAAVEVEAIRLHRDSLAGVKSHAA